MEQRLPGVPIIISDTEPNIPASTGFSESDWKWYNTSNGMWYDRNGGWTMQGAEHTHDHLADMIALLNSGVTGTKTIGAYTLTFDHGVLTNFEGA